jgi:4-carboxymuconolactone decarboxylase
MSERYEVGIGIREEMFGPEGAQKKVDKFRSIAKEFEEKVVTEYCFGSTWSREGLSRDKRSLLTVAMLVALGRREEIGIHIRGALSNGADPAEILELIYHSAAYCGIPAAKDGFDVALHIFDEKNISY